MPSSISSVTRGWARRDSFGNIQWGTFTTQTQTESGWYPTYKAQCACNDDCGKWLFRYDPYHTIYERKFKFNESTSVNVEVVHGGVPTKFIIKVNNSVVSETPFSGLSGYQQQLTQYLIDRGLPNQIIDPTSTRTIPVTVTIGDEIEVEVISIDPQNASYRFMVPCGGLEPIDCVLSDWSNWSTWVDNGDGTESRSRTRTIITSPENGGAVCGPLVENQTQPIPEVDCVLSGWSDWSPWVSDGFGLDTRTRNRIVITPASGGGEPCGPLTETETRPTPTAVNCELSDWSNFSEHYEYDTASLSLCKIRTRTVIVPPANGGAPCGPLADKECIPSDIRDWNFYLKSAAGDIELQDFKVGHPEQGYGEDVSLNEGGNVMIYDSDFRYVGFSGDKIMHRLRFTDVSTPVGDPVDVIFEDASLGTLLHTFTYYAGPAVDYRFELPLVASVNIRFEL